MPNIFFEHNILNNFQKNLPLLSHARFVKYQAVDDVIPSTTKVTSVEKLHSEKKTMGKNLSCHKNMGLENIISGSINRGDSLATYTLHNTLSC